MKKTGFLKDDYIVILKGNGGKSFLENYIYKQREDCPYIRPYYDSRGSKGNGWTKCKASDYDYTSWRYATDSEIALYDITDRPGNISHVSKKASILYYLGRKFIHKDGNKLYTIDSHYSFPKGEVNITWGAINNAIYSAEQVVDYFKAGTWVLQEFPKTGYCMHLSTEFIRYIAEKCGSDIRYPHSDFKGIAWDEHDYLFIQSLSLKTEYKWEYIKQFINNNNLNLKKDDKSNESIDSRTISEPVQRGERQSFNVQELGGRGKGFDTSNRRRRTRDISFESPRRRSGEAIHTKSRSSRNTSDTF